MEPNRRVKHHPLVERAARDGRYLKEISRADDGNTAKVRVDASDLPETPVYGMRRA
jgi:hypothetical protein